MAKDLPWEEAIQLVLEESDGALRCAEIAEQVSLRGLRRSVGANPAKTVAVVLSNAFAEANSPFQRVARGQYTLTAKLSRLDQVEANDSSDEEASDTGALRAFGM